MASPAVFDHDGARAAIERLDPLDAALLAVLALCHDAATRTHWLELARDRGVGGATGGGLLTAEVDAGAERLIAAGLVGDHRLSPHRVVHTVDATVAMAALAVARDRGRLPRPVARDGREGHRPHIELYSDQVASLRLAAIEGDATALARALSRIYAPGRRELGAWLFRCLGPAPRVEWLRLLPAELALEHATLLVRSQWVALRPLDRALVSFAMSDGDKQLRLEVGRARILAGQPCDPADLAPLPKWGAEGLALLDAFWSGDHARAHDVGDEAVGRMKTRKTRALPDLEGICHFLAGVAVSAARPEVAHSLGSRLEAMAGPDGPSSVLGAIHAALIGDPAPYAPRAGAAMGPPDWLSAFVCLLHDAWLGPGPAGDDRGARRREAASREAAGWAERAAAAGYAPIARELAAVAAALEGRPAGGLARAFRPLPAWEAALVGLEAIAAGSAASAEARPRSRELVWEVELGEYDVEIRPRIREGGRARKGKSISLARLQGGEEDDLLDEADRRVLAAADADGWSRTSRGHGRLGWPSAVALVGHPRVIGPDGEPIAVERGRPRIHVRRVGPASHLEVLPADLREERFAAEQPGPGRLVVFERGPELERLLAILGREGGLTVPEEGRERMARALARLSAAAPIDLEGDVAAGARDVPADPRPVFQLGWSGAALAIAARVAPFGPDGPTVRPGAGSAVLVAEPAPGGHSLRRCARDLGDERRRLDGALAACPALAGMADDEHHFTAASLEDALDVLLELADLGDDVVISWHGAQRLAVPRRADLGDLRVRVGADTAWLDVDVSLQVDEASVMRFGELLRAREGRRYVVLPRGRFLVLSDALRQHVEGFASIGSVRGETLRAPPALLPLVEELAEGTAEPSFDAAVLARLQALRELAGQTPRVPRGFGAVLRDYQREGFEWMARLAEAGLGACLADDMGLGKTLQALALLVHRARLGPALVVCPTSVVRHWMAEAARFASPLVVHALGEAEDRAALIGRLGPRDVLVASYGLLVSEADSLAEVAFATAVLDEAHALKNPRTQRAEAARRIRADARVALTGTPIENHLGELWSLFSAISPGLLGTRTEFDDRFASVAAGDRAGAGRLRAILRPFLLRRLKSQVTSELPPRTEITLRVAPYPEERAFYEALRRRAVERVAALDPRKARFHILSEITRLRQAAVDPRLLESGGPPGAKLDVLVDRLGELRAEGHRALVFTQFLGSLSAVRDRLAAEGIEHHELDGSTPAAERARRIDAFQAGEGDVFLLSLRAGGTGINLTGADYVFHLDPWWNPAVEDQASDRAHRIGQERPVTIYRLVSEGTIEEKILALHDTKRQMAEDILTGLETSSTLDVNELLRLLQD